ncbi:MAG: hypothetical protein EXX96DRAFT_541084 [Benjaminiella poitrasii]|nr:MAG: hypothetical protein EXX96DRAFT_541084 [Benjaminiella poitrasii]
MANDTERAAQYDDFYKTIQNAANAIAAQANAIHTPFMSQVNINFAIKIVGLLLSYIACFKVADDTVESVNNLIDGNTKEGMVGDQVNVIEDDKNVKVEHKGQLYVPFLQDTILRNIQESYSLLILPVEPLSF